MDSPKVKDFRGIAYFSRKNELRIIVTPYGAHATLTPTRINPDTVFKFMIFSDGKHGTLVYYDSWNDLEAVSRELRQAGNMYQDKDMLNRAVSYSLFAKHLRENLDNYINEISSWIKQNHDIHITSTIPASQSKFWSSAAMSIK